MADILRENVPVNVSDVDKNGRLTVFAAFNMFQNAAFKHAEELGVGKAVLENAGQAWVLSRMSVLMERRPVNGEQIAVRSWPRGSQKLFAVRDYDMRDKDDIPVVRGRSGWLVLDMEKKRPLRPQTMMGGLPHNEGLDALPDGIEALESAPSLSKKGERRAAYSDIDYVGHVNNARYVEWIQDIADPGLFYGAAQIRLDINYLAEVLPGETVELWSGECAKPATTFFEGRRVHDGQTAFRAELWTGV